ncbi:HET-domain-containing protein [Thozetella sp. PMI_491]|nr:HET-domain-containing protein [Thozetella sp. PMI_491]
MKLLFIYTALVAFASSAIAQTTGEKTFRMRKPYWYQYVSAGDAFEVEWDVIDGGQMGAKVHLALYGGTATSVSFISTLATGIFNTGSYVWNVDTSSIPSKPVYAIRVMLDSDETVYDQSGIFFISASKSSSSLTATDSATYTTSPESTATGFESTTSGSESIDGSPEVQCRLEVVDLKENPSYLALSYTWGPPTAKAAAAAAAAIERDAFVVLHSADMAGSGSSSYTMPITRNLNDFLRRARGDSELAARRFWVDAICINQQDAAERASQVGFMARIYRSADAVVAWLGKEDAHTAHAFALIKTLANLCKDCLDHVRPRRMGSDSIANILGPLANESAWSSLREFWRRSYFTRAWIIQEVTLAKRVVVRCGGYLLDWDAVVQASYFLTVTPWTRFLNPGVGGEPGQGYTVSNHALPMYLTVIVRMEKSEGDSLLYWLVRARRFLCLDPRDKVYALLGVAEVHAKKKLHLRPVYGDHSVIETYVSAAIQMLEDEDELLLLSQAEGQDFRNIEGLPSWVPDWSCSRTVGLGIVGYKRFAAAKNMAKSLRLNEPSLTLSVRGLRLDQVVQVGESKDEAIIRRKAACFPGWLSLLSSLPQRYHTGQPRAEVFWRTLITDTASRVPDPAQHPAPDEYRFAFRDWLARIVHSWADEPVSGEKKRFLEELERIAESDETALFPSVASSKRADTLAEYDRSAYKARSKSLPDGDDYDTLINHSSQTRLLRTNVNYLGLATTSVREGDIVWIVQGSRVPLILRQIGGDKYHLVGGAYIHGFMHGEALVPNTAFEDVKIL